MSLVIVAGLAVAEDVAGAFKMEGVGRAGTSPNKKGIESLASRWRARSSGVGTRSWVAAAEEAEILGSLNVTALVAPTTPNPTSLDETRIGAPEHKNDCLRAVIDDVDTGSGEQEQVFEVLGGCGSYCLGR